MGLPGTLNQPYNNLKPTVDARKLEHARAPNPRPKKEGTPAQITLDPRSNFLESTPIYANSKPALWLSLEGRGAGHRRPRGHDHPARLLARLAAGPQLAGFWGIPLHPFMFIYLLNTYVYVCIDVYIYILYTTYIYRYVYTICVYIYIYTCTCIYIYMYTYVYVHIVFFWFGKRGWLCALRQAVGDMRYCQREKHDSHSLPSRLLRTVVPY